MNILVTHGYLLSGTGSNLYVDNLIRAFCRAGQQVFLLAQESAPENFDYISEIYDFSPDNRSFQLRTARQTEFPGSCRFFRPDLNGFLPVYVFDHYAGFEVKEFPDCSDDEIANYIRLNRQALLTLLEHFQIDVIQTNHTILFPSIVAEILQRQKIPHFVTVHGSALNFSVKKDNRLLPSTEQGFASASVIFVDSRYACAELIEFMQKNRMSNFIERVQIIPAGVDINRFDILKTSRRESMNRFIEGISPLVTNGRGRTKILSEKMLRKQVRNAVEAEQLVEEIRTAYDYRFIDQNLKEKLNRVDWENERIVLFIGKYLWTKGIYLIILAMLFILRKYPGTKFIFSGFGPFREIAELMLNLMAQKKIDLLLSICRSSPLCRDPHGKPLPLLEESFKVQQKQISEALQKMDGKLLDGVIFTGIVDHANLRHLLPCADVLIAPSVFPEAFGMVAIEALSAGVFPIVTYQSSFREIADLIAQKLPADSLSIQPVELDGSASIKIAQNVMNLFTYLDKLKADNRISNFRKSLRSLATKYFSWQHIADQYVKFYQKFAEKEA